MLRRSGVRQQCPKNLGTLLAKSESEQVSLPIKKEEAGPMGFGNKNRRKTTCIAAQTDFANKVPWFSGHLNLQNKHNTLLLLVCFLPPPWDRQAFTKADWLNRFIYSAFITTRLYGDFGALNLLCCEGIKPSGW